MTLISRLPWPALRRKTPAVAAIGALGLAALLTMAGPAHAAGGTPSTLQVPELAVSALRPAVVPGTVASLTDTPDTGPDGPVGKAVETTGKATDTPSAAPPQSDPTSRVETPAPEPAVKPVPVKPVPVKQAPVKQVPSKAAVPVQPVEQPEQPAAATAESETAVAAPPASESPWPTYVNTESAQDLVSAGGTAAGSNSAAGVDADLSLASKSSSGPGLMTWLLVLLGLTLAAGVAVALYAVTHVRGQRRG